MVVNLLTTDAVEYVSNSEISNVEDQFKLSVERSFLSNPTKETDLTISPISIEFKSTEISWSSTILITSY